MSLSQSEQKQLLVYLQKKLEDLFPWLEKKEIECYRWYDHELADFPFSIDVYLDYLHIHCSDLQYIDTKLKSIVSLLIKEFEFEKNKIFVKSREQQKGKTQYNKLQASRERFVVRENGCLFYVNLADYFDSGLFLDHRETRDLVKKEANHKKILNLFSYTGAFSVYAACGGASETVTVDTSNTYLEWAKENFKLNRITKGKHAFLKADAIKYLKDASREKKYFFDIIIIDPPTFSNSKSREDIFEVKRDHVELINNALAILEPGGVIYFSTNFTKFKLKAELLYSKKITEITEDTTPLDFKKSPFVRKCYRIEKMQTRASLK